MMSVPEALEEGYCAVVASWRSKLGSDDGALAELLENFQVPFAYNSGRIENASITYHDTRDVFEDGRAVGFTGDVRTLFEIQNLKECHRLMLACLKSGTPLDESLVLEFHRTLTQGTYDERRWDSGERPGSYKLGDYVVGVSEAGSRPEDVPADVQGLLQEVQVATPGNILTVASYFHLAFEAIHPFADGNGRCGRALMNYLFLTNDHPPVIVYDDDKAAYYGAIEVWDIEGDIVPMKDFLMAEAVKTWNRFLLPDPAS